ncbi:hypothetical protein [Nocardia nepalensis]|uniref:hypothetical protein n=1 Tax=Nocardia nepalensis TaxID=3375448 RepID=UPI003B66C85D
MELRHEDFTAERELTICRRDKDSGARMESSTSRSIPISTELVRLYADHLHQEYGDLARNYVFGAGGLAQRSEGALAITTILTPPHRLPELADSAVHSGEAEIRSSTLQFAAEGSCVGRVLQGSR